MEDKIWANSGDSHFLEPTDLFQQILPPALAERMPRSVKGDDGWETVYIDGEVLRRRLPKPIREGEYKGMDIVAVSHRPPGAGDLEQRIKDLDGEGIWGEVTYPSLGMWANYIKDPALAREGAKALNDWAMAEIQQKAPARMVTTAMLPLLDVQDAVAE